MQNKLITLAVLTSFAGAAAAQSSVTIYGVVDAGFEYNKGLTSADKNLRLQSGQQSGNRLGFRGVEDLGNGLSASFVLESGFNVDDGSIGSKLFSRQAFVGLNGGFGSVKLGRQQTPMYNALLAVDPFSINLAGGAQRIFGGGLYGEDPLFRADNALVYTTPNFSGLKGDLMYVFGEQAGSTSARRQAQAAFSYANGPINAQFVYHDGNGVARSAALGGGTVDVKTAFLGGTYDFGIAKAHLAFADTKTEAGVTEVKNRNFLVGASAKVGPGTVLASWIRNDVRALAAGETDQFAIGYTHPLSKRTNLYTSAAYTKNDSGVAVRSYAAGESSRLFNVGVRHQF